MKKRIMKYNWDEIQKYYDDGHTWREIQIKFGCSSSAIHKATKRKVLVTRSSSDAIKLSLSRGRMGHRLTQETKDKISKSRIKYLQEHPDKVPYIINHSSKISYPEKIFMNALNADNITGWQYNYRNGIYSYDFAFPEIKLDVEIDGSTHLNEKVKRIDGRRDKWSGDNGWNVLRFTANEVKTDVVSCLNKVKSFFC